jgi:hypothetical protein
MTGTNGPPEDTKRTRKNFRIALVFGITMATIEMGLLLYFMYC